MPVNREIIVINYSIYNIFNRGYVGSFAWEMDKYQTKLGIGISQLRIAETEKYPHVTYFLSGGREEPYPGEERILEARAGDALEIHRRDDLVGVDGAAPQRGADAGVSDELVHGR